MQGVFLASCLIPVLVALCAASKDDDYTQRCIADSGNVQTEMCTRFSQCCFNSCNLQGKGAGMRCSFNTATRFDLNKTSCRCQPLDTSASTQQVEFVETRTARAEGLSTAALANVGPLSNGGKQEWAILQWATMMTGCTIMMLLTTV